MGALELLTNLGWAALQIVNLIIPEPGVRGRQQPLQPGRTVFSRPAVQISRSASEKNGWLQQADWIHWASLTAFSKPGTHVYRLTIGQAALNLAEWPPPIAPV
jgi:hypothetical protein